MFTLSHVPSGGNHPELQGYAPQCLHTHWEHEHSVSIGFVVDSLFFDNYGRDSTLLNKTIDDILTMANGAYVEQFRIRLLRGEVLNITSSDPSSPVRYDCSSSIENDVLKAMASFRSEKRKSKEAAWVLLSGCSFKSSSGTVTLGLANPSTLCNTVESSAQHAPVAVVSYSQKLWRSVAHELGHIFVSLGLLSV